MNKLDHVYLHINNTFYKDYTLYLQHAYFGYREEMLAKWNNCIHVDEEARKDLKNITQYTDATVFPKKNSNLYVAPGIPYTLDDIRKNYTIKRAPDSGDYNIISPLKNVSSVGFSVINTFAIFPDRKEMVELKSWYPLADLNIVRQEIYKQVLIAIPDADYEEMTIVTEAYSRHISIYSLHDANAYKMLLDGTFTKPCVEYNHLDITGQNPLTLDTLKLVYEFGSVSRSSKNAVENIILQLNALNQTAWRDYKGTINLIFLRMYRNPTSVFRRLMMEPDSTLSKVVKNFKAEFSFNTDILSFCSEEDFLLAQVYVKDALKLEEGSKFVTVQGLLYKLSNNYIPLVTFSQLFNNIVRITAKNEGSN